MKFSCTCGRALQVGDELAGKRVRCPACLAIVTAPAEEIPEAKLVEASVPPPAVVAAPSPATPAPRPRGVPLFLFLAAGVAALALGIFLVHGASPRPRYMPRSGMTFSERLCYARLVEVDASIEAFRARNGGLLPREFSELPYAERLSQCPFGDRLEVTRTRKEIRVCCPKHTDVVCTVRVDDPIRVELAGPQQQR